MLRSEPQLTVGDRFRIREGSDSKIKYIVVIVCDDADGGVICHDENEDGKLRRTKHCIGHKPLRALFERGVLEINGERVRFDVNGKKKDEPAVRYDMSTAGIVFEDQLLPF